MSATELRWRKLLEFNPLHLEKRFKEHRCESVLKARSLETPWTVSFKINNEIQQNSK